MMGAPTLACYAELVRMDLQKLSEDSFDRMYGKEGNCLYIMANWRWPNGFECRKCGHDEFCVLSRRVMYQCNKCRHQASVTAGTTFNSIKLPLTKIVHAAWIVVNQEKVTAMHLHRELDVSYNAAWRLRRKLCSLLKGER